MLPPSTRVAVRPFSMRFEVVDMLNTAVTCLITAIFDMALRSRSRRWRCYMLLLLFSASPAVFLFIFFSRCPLQMLHFRLSRHDKMLLRYASRYARAAMMHTARGMLC